MCPLCFASRGCCIMAVHGLRDSWQKNRTQSDCKDALHKNDISSLFWFPPSVWSNPKSLHKPPRMKPRAATPRTLAQNSVPSVKWWVADVKKKSSWWRDNVNFHLVFFTQVWLLTKKPTYQPKYASFAYECVSENLGWFKDLPATFSFSTVSLVPFFSVHSWNGIVQ